MATEKEYYSSPIALRNGGTGVLVNTGSVSADDESAKPLVRESLELNQRTYTSLSQIGLTAPCTCTEVFNKLITIYPARLLVHSQGNISDVPYAGTIEFVCNSSLSGEAHIYPDSGLYKPKYRTYNSGLVISWSDYADGGSGSSSYDDLTDKPSINSVTLSGNKTSANLGLANASHTHTYSDLSGVAPSVHTHSAADVTSGTFSGTYTFSDSITQAKSGNSYEYTKSTNVEKGVAPSSNVAQGIVMTDMNDETLGFVRHRNHTNGYGYIDLYTSDSGTNRGISIRSDGELQFTNVDPIPVSAGGTGATSLSNITVGSATTSTTCSGNASTATSLQTARTIRTNLASTSSASFNGTANITPGVTGTLAVGNGGTGVTSNPSMLTDLESTTAASVFATSPRPGITGTLPIANGGTGATTIDGILNALIDNGNYSDFVSYANATASDADTDITYRGYRYLTGITGKTNYPSTVGARGFLIQLGASSSGGNVQFLTTFTSSSCDLWFRVKYSASVGYLSWVNIV